MPTGVKVKLCGMTESADIPAAILAGASYVGFVFFSKSPRHLALQDAAFLARSVPMGICKVALVVDPDNSALDHLLDVVPIDMLQLHGGESPDRVAEIQDRFGLPVMKAVGVADESDLPRLDDYMRVADQVLVDAKPSKGADLPGGNGLTFDWRLIAGRRWPVPWMLAGGLIPQNVREAIERSGASQVDVSTGIESAPGVNDAKLMRDFVAAAQGN